jgi:DNA-binding LacI/PurR family transcriptional regulator
MANIKDVAKHANVSISTVSHVIRGTKSVSKKLRARIERAIADLDYQTNPVASRLKSKTSNTIGLIIPNISRIFFNSVIKGIQEECVKLGFNLTFCETNDQLEKEKYFIRMLQSHWVDGIILGSVADSTDTAYLNFISHLGSTRKRIPIVSLERRFQNTKIDSVLVNNHQGGRLATRHLLECGCKTIVFVAAPGYSSMGKDRYAGMKQELKEYKSKINEIVVQGDFSPVSGYQALKLLLNEGRSFDAVFSANDQMAVGALRAIREHGFRVPEDIKIVGFDNAFIASIVTPSLTTIHVPKYQMGVTSVGLLSRRLQNHEAEYLNVELPINLIVRQSTELRAETSWELFGW